MEEIEKELKKGKGGSLITKILSGELKVTPFWTKEGVPHFLSRTPVTYYKVPLLSTLTDRGLENKLIESLAGYLPDGAYIAGGFLTSIMLGEKNATDIDFFFRDAKAFRDTVSLLNTPPDEPEAWAWKGYECSSSIETDREMGLRGLRFITFKHKDRLPFQLIKLVWYDSPEHVIDTFDLTCSQFITDGESLWCNPMALYDIAHKKLVLHRMQFPASTMRRIIKYTHKGFYACPGSLSRIAQETADIIQKFPDMEDVTGVVYVD